MKRIKVIHVHLIGKRKDFYFGSITAIFNTISEEDLGVSKNYLLHYGLSGGGTYVNSKVCIKQSYLITSNSTPR